MMESDKHLKGTFVIRTRYSMNGKSLKVLCSVPLKQQNVDINLFCFRPHRLEVGRETKQLVIKRVHLKGEVIKTYS